MVRSYDAAAIRTLIEARVAQLEIEIRAKLGEAADMSSVLERTDDHGDQSVADDAATTDIADVQRDIEEQIAAAAALKRLDDGSYGLCIDCTEPIPPARLSAQPLASRCLVCQTRAEHMSGVRHTSL
jgi:RNA polymerase-binding transcription factor DksA